MTNQQNQKYEAGRQTALSDARTGKVHEPTSRDSKFWAQGYRDACEEMQKTFGAAWKEKMAQR